jgi:hypothetical protein
MKRRVEAKQVDVIHILVLANARPTNVGSYRRSQGVYCTRRKQSQIDQDKVNDLFN